LVRLLNLGFADMQAFDEGLYAVRTLGVVDHGAWLDQSSAAIGGLYSSLHPPLYVWLSALVVGLFGNTEASFRLVSVLFGAFTLPVIYWLGGYLGNSQREGRSIGLVAALLYALNPFVDFYARQGQFDTTLVFFLSLAILWFLRGVEKDAFRWYLLAGVAVGLGLMTKLFVAAGIPIVIALWIVLVRREEKRRLWLGWATLSAVAVAIALPWHAMIVIRHGDGDPLFLLRASQTFDRFVTGIEGNQKSLEVFYYINQLFVLFPLGVAWSIYGLIGPLRRREPSELLLIVWFALFFTVFTLMRTKLEFYLLPMLVPLALVGAREMVRAMAGEMSKRLLGILTGLTAVAVAWSASQEWRTAIKGVILTGREAGSANEGGWLLIALCLAGVLLGALIWWRGLPSGLTRRLAILVFVSAFALSLYNFAVADRERYLDGGGATAEFITSRSLRRLVAVGYETNPQLTWYLGGVDLGWRPGYSLGRIDPTGHDADVRGWLAESLDSLTLETTVLIERDRLVRGRKFTSQEVIPQGWGMLFETRRYTVISRGGRP
jgi:4-amino-4-deoxy-L-arabinose transferase-like glycosyltransferase